MLDTERPRLVIHTGDVIFGKPAEASLREILSLIADRKIRSPSRWGNHDEEFGKKSPGGVRYYQKHSLQYQYAGQRDIRRIERHHHLSSTTDDTVKWVFYLFDSNRHSKLPAESKDYDYIHFDQIAWYRNHSQSFHKTQRRHTCSFIGIFHIPLPEYNAIPGWTRAA